MDRSLASLIEQLPAIPTRTPKTHRTGFAFTRLWNKVVIDFIGQEPQPTKRGHQPSNEEKVAHAVYLETEELFLSFLMRLAGEIEADDTISRHELSNRQLVAVTKWLRMGRNCGSPSCVQMRQQERRWQVVEWLDEHYLDIWVEVERKIPKAALSAQWKEQVG